MPKNKKNKKKKKSVPGKAKIQSGNRSNNSGNSNGPTADYLEGLFGDSVASKTLDLMYEIFRHQPKGASIFSELEDMLDSCTDTGIPEYTRFGLYLYHKTAGSLDVVEPRFEALTNVKDHTGDMMGDIMTDFYVLLLYREYEKKFRNKALNIGNKDILKYKLLLNSVLNLGERFVRSTIELFNDSWDTRLDEDLENLDWIQLKNRFLEAIMLRQKSVAFKLLGRLTNLDPGESSYFEALAHFNNEDYDDAIYFAGKVARGNPDYPLAAAMILYCYAIKGDFDKFVEFLKNEDKLKIDSGYLLYLLQVLIYNSKSTDQLKEGLMMLFPESVQSKIVAAKGIMPQSDLVRNSARLAVERIELLEDIELYSDVSETGDIPDELAERFQRVELALRIHPELEKNLAGDALTRADISRSIQTLLLSNYTPSFEDYFILMSAQRRLGETEAFIKNVASNAENLLLYRDDRAWDLIEAAYVESVVRNDETHSEGLRKLLIRNGRMDERKLDDYISDVHIKQGLSSNGKIAYTSAEWQYRKALEEDYGWKDAGMLSLAYFRIIELELNQKIVLPLISSLKSIRDEYDNVLALCPRNQRDAVIKRWSRIIGEFEKIAAGNSEGLMLGELEKFFSNLSPASGGRGRPDSTLTTLLYNTISQLLSDPDGVDALNNGEFTKMVRYDVRNKFRNPPAHTKYLHIEVAKECKKYVDEHLKKLFAWVKS